MNTYKKIKEWIKFKLYVHKKRKEAKKLKDEDPYVYK